MENVKILYSNWFLRITITIRTFFHSWITKDSSKGDLLLLHGVATGSGVGGGTQQRARQYDNPDC